MNAPLEHKPMDAFDLSQALDRFISDNRHHRGYVYRWFADSLKGTLALARHLHSIGTDAKQLNKEYRAASDAFRLAEIETERAEKLREIDRLNDEAGKLKRSDQQ